MAIETYGGSALGKLGLAVLLGKATVAALVLSLGTAVLVVAAGSLIIKEIANIEILHKKNLKAGQASGT